MICSVGTTGFKYVTNNVFSGLHVTAMLQKKSKQVISFMGTGKNCYQCRNLSFLRFVKLSSFTTPLSHFCAALSVQMNVKFAVTEW